MSRLPSAVRGKTRSNEPAPVVSLGPDSHQAESSYQSVLVAQLALSYSAASLRTAKTIAAERSGEGISLLIPIVVPQSQPIDAELPHKERAAEALIEQARLEFGRKIRGRWVKVRAGQFGRVVVDEAVRLSARAIVMSVPPDLNSSGSKRSIDAVMAARPCRVVLQADPHARRLVVLPKSRRGVGSQ